MQPYLLAHASWGGGKTADKNIISAKKLKIKVRHLQLIDKTITF